MFTLEDLNTVFISKATAARRLVLSHAQLNYIIFKLKLKTPKVCGNAVLYTVDVERLKDSPILMEARLYGVVPNRPVFPAEKTNVPEANS